jgi:hypothetical protein
MNALYDEIDRLKRVNAELLAACKESRELLIISCGVANNCATQSEKETIAQIEAAIQKAEA